MDENGNVSTAYDIVKNMLKKRLENLPGQMLCIIVQV